MWSNVSLVRKLILSADYRDLHIYNGIKPGLSVPVRDRYSTQSLGYIAGGCHGKIRILEFLKDILGRVS